jgi:hypothetical protein
MSKQQTNAGSDGLRRTPHYAPAREAVPVKAGKPAPAPVPAPANHNNPVILGADLAMVGYQMAMAAFNQRDWTRISRVVSDANATDELRRRNGLSAVYGAAVGLSDALIAVNASGHVRIAGSIPSRHELEYEVSTDLVRFNQLWATLTKTANRVLDAAPGLTISSSSRSQREEAKAAEPVEVKVVSQPARVTTTRVDRNSSGDIVSTFHLEEDALKPDGQA